MTSWAPVMVLGALVAGSVAVFGFIGLSVQVIGGSGQKKKGPASETLVCMRPQPAVFSASHGRLITSTLIARMGSFLSSC